ncbi:Rz1-like phage lysis protein [Burkholderia phage BcepIL02]|uniref:Rz1-like phage lysis protein n=1 Tax=Burkholderia phage BcepIL02 TaxID=2886898 RepID=C5IHR8_9CAUD|nr:Rz-like spanin [Burkholderia phage BcepIL02]ACR15069.1 Rz1-like phage lysis protein [Burkholderia phage BcepIL02]
MRSRKMSAFALLSMLGLCSCASAPSAPPPPPVTCAAPPPPPAWMMTAPSNSMQELDNIISPSGTASNTTGK